LSFFVEEYKGKYYEGGEEKAIKGDGEGWCGD
jgi:hypothetical protein